MGDGKPGPRVASAAPALRPRRCLRLVRNRHHAGSGSGSGSGSEVRAVCLEGLRLGRGRHSCQKTWNLNGAAPTVLGIKGGSIGG